MPLPYKRLFFAGLFIALAHCFVPEVHGGIPNVRPIRLVSPDANDAKGLAMQSLVREYIQQPQDSARNKFIAALLAFPLPFGMLGLHRVYLGAKPIIPVLYIVTIGGVLGILPFVDMMVLLLSGDAKPFFRNSKILMWHQDNGG